MKTQQQIFNVVAEHLLRQGRKSLTPMGECAYRSLDNCKCAVGCLISDEAYSRDMENKRVATLFHRWSGEMFSCDLNVVLHEDLLFRLQGVHDDHAVDDWPEQLDIAAVGFQLDVSVIQRTIEHLGSEA